jgi:FAD/FMN-containing dehydrogenase/Fe-S oxidoreductase
MATLTEQIELEKNKNSTANTTDHDSIHQGQKNFDLHYQTKDAAAVNIAALENDLHKAIKGEVRFDDGSRALYATDASNYRQVPIGVVLPVSEEDAIKTIALCKKHKAPLLSRGGGTSLAGQCCNVAVVMDMSKYFNKILSLDKENKLVTVQPGIVLDEMRMAAEREAGLTFGPDPATHNHCTIGGMLGNNSCGVHSVMSSFYGYGARTSDNTESLTVVTYDGLKMKIGATSDEAFEQILNEGGRKAEIYTKLKSFRDKYADLIRERFPKIPRRVSGYNLPELLPENGFNVARALVGSESTCVTIVDATMKLVTAPVKRTLVVLGYPDIYHAGYDVPEILEFKPIGLEGIDDLLIDYMRKKGLHPKYIPLLPDGNGWLMVEFGGDSIDDADKKARGMMEALKKKNSPPSIRLFDNPEEELQLWTIRESGLGATAWVPGEPMSVPGWEDSAVEPEQVGDYLKDLRQLFTKYGYNPSLYGHFGQGCIHCRVQFDLFTEEGLKQYKKFTIEAAHLVVKYGGSISGEHGDGQARGDLLEIMYGKEIVQAFREFKAIWDPEGKMNPGKIIDSYGQLSNLRIDNHYNPAEQKTFFQYPSDDYDFSRATLRCVGVGECRRHEGGTMCPSYMVTREEEHSTRGRARMLFEMLQNNPLKKVWKDEHVKESLDLCLACKGCKGDCPVNVDMATYKSEFLSHYYAGKLRPRSAYAFGWIYWWSRIASVIPSIANFFLHAPVLSNIMKAVAGIDPQRTMPKYAEVTFKEWFSNRDKRKAKSDRPRVILWADTFNNFFLPETLVAGVDVLEAAGFKVVVPKQSLCCGRPLYDFGMLKTAKKMLQTIMHLLRDEIQRGTPIVGLEPSCVAVFRDELYGLFPHDEDAKRLQKNVFTLAEFLQEKAPGFSIPELAREALVHGHCHHKAIMKMDSDREILKKMKLKFSILDSGCCGMAGYFGYEKGSHYDVSIKCGERVLLPAVREVSENTLIVADGFSCREQIKQQTNRQALHLAQVLQMSLTERNKKRSFPYPEHKYVNGKKLKNPNKKRNTALCLAAFGIGLWAGLKLKST